jgi:hypothetical protein
MEQTQARIDHSSIEQSAAMYGNFGQGRFNTQFRPVGAVRSDGLNLVRGRAVTHSLCHPLMTTHPA